MMGRSLGPPLSLRLQPQLELDLLISELQIDTQQTGLEMKGNYLSGVTKIA